MRHAVGVGGHVDCGARHAVDRGRLDVLEKQVERHGAVAADGEDDLAALPPGQDQQCNDEADRNRQPAALRELQKGC